MKKFFIFFLFILISASCKQERLRIEQREVDFDQVNIAEKFTNDFFNAGKAGDTLNFENRVSQQMKNVFNSREQTPLYKEFTERIGEFIKSSFEEAWKVTGIETYHVYRFKAEFKGQPELWEIRVVIDQNNLVAGYYVGKWDDNY